MIRRVVAQRFVGAVFVAVFGLCVAVQFNDPDPAAWIAIYAAAGLVCALLAFGAVGKRAVVPAVVVGAVALVWLLTLLPSAVSFLQSNKEPVNFTMKTGDAEEEEAREAGGLALVVAACAFVAGAARRL